MEIKLSCGKNAGTLDSSEKEMINSIASEYAIKFERSVREVISFDIHLKCFQKKGNIKRYYINARLLVPKYSFDVSSEGWILHDVIKDAMQRLMNEIEGKCHSSDNHGIGKRGKC
jgi:hypothetical protein